MLYGILTFLLVTSIRIFHISTTRIQSLFSLEDLIYNDVKRAASDLQAAIAQSEIPKSSANYVRAITGYLPAGIPRFMDEFKSMYLSVAIMRTNQPRTIKTDLLIFCERSSQTELEELGCSTQKRLTWDESEKCVILFREDSLREAARGYNVDPLSKYENAKSVDFLLGMSEQLMNTYDYLLRTDLDVFITPGFADWLPKNLTLLITGQGGYGSVNAEHHLKWISERLNLRNSGYTNIGSTWYGATRALVATADLSVSVMRWLHTQEFSEYDKCCSGVDGWPNWHYGVLSMYAGHIAVNSVDQKYLKVNEEDEYRMDFFSDSSDPLTSKVKHIHSWHTEKRFSKFQFQAGAYKDIDLTEFMDMSTARDYATVIAVSSKRMVNNEFAFIIQNHEQIKNGSWIKRTI